MRVLRGLIGLAVVLAVAGCGSGGSTSSEPAVLSRGIKGESTTEKATKAHLSAADCAALAKFVEVRAKTRLTHRSTPTPPLSRCRLEGPGISINVYLDTGFAAHQRYENRVTETDQFGVGDPAKVPHPVPGVGEKAAYEAGANWIPSLQTLLAVRGDRWVTVTISVARWSDRRLRDEAAGLGRAAFRLSAET
ncbi:MAG TPA: hypothetical protein VMH33_08660 [Solirubrobacterales bacterium]|nr:hypothetical protein [Solirubrobacterales bacterium]